QRLITLSINLDRLEHNLPESVSEIRRRIGEAREQVVTLAQDVHALSRKLHPATLEFLGLAKAAARFCVELSATPNVNIDFECENIPKEISKDISLCLYRVLQEALHNAIKFSGSVELAVSLRCESNQIYLTVRDNGIGFDPATMKGHGLGLTTMEERVKL